MSPSSSDDFVSVFSSVGLESSSSGGLNGTMFVSVLLFFEFALDLDVLTESSVEESGELDSLSVLDFFFGLFFGVFFGDFLSCLICFALDFLFGGGVDDELESSDELVSVSESSSGRPISSASLPSFLKFDLMEATLLTYYDAFRSFGTQHHSTAFTWLM